jgi:hypothetical protein
LVVVVELIIHIQLQELVNLVVLVAVALTAVLSVTMVRVEVELLVKELLVVLDISADLMVLVAVVVDQV